MIQAKPVDALRNLAAPRDLIEWVRKLPPDTAAHSSWVDAARADWMPAHLDLVARLREKLRLAG